MRGIVLSPFSLRNGIAQLTLSLNFDTEGERPYLAIGAIKGGEAGEALRDGCHGLCHHRDYHLAVLVLRSRVRALRVP